MPSAMGTPVGLITQLAPSGIVDQREGEVSGCRPGKPAIYTAPGGHTGVYGSGGIQLPLTPPRIDGGEVSQAVKRCANECTGHEVENVCALSQYEGSGIIIDNAATKSILGANALAYITRRWECEPIVVRTANGESHVNMMGSVRTEYGHEVHGYIVEESKFSLWAMEDALRMKSGGQYVQDINDAYMTYADGTVVSFEKKDRLWQINLEGSEPDGKDGVSEGVMALAVEQIEGDRGGGASETRLTTFDSGSQCP